MRPVAIAKPTEAKGRVIESKGAAVQASLGGALLCR